VLPLRDNVPTRSTPFVTIGLIAANALGGFAFGAATILLVKKRRPVVPSSRYPVY
jgi:hypothetical protein